MNITFNRAAMLEAFTAVSGVAPKRSPKPTLQSLLLRVGEGGSATLTATDLEVTIQQEVSGVTSGEPGSCVLPTERLGQILRSSRDVDLSVSTSGESMTIKGVRSEFKLPTEDPSLFPASPECAGPSHYEIATEPLSVAIKRTSFAADAESTRYALGGVMFDFTGSVFTAVATDGRRLSRQTSDVSPSQEGLGAMSGVVPLKALRLIARNLRSGTVQVAIDASSVYVKSGPSTIHSRLVSGRFPRYQDIFPKEVVGTIPVVAGDFKAAVDQASIVTSEETRGISLSFAAGLLSIEGKSADVGAADVQMPIIYDGPTIAMMLNAPYIAEVLKVFDESDAVTLEIVDEKTPIVIRDGGSYTHVLMPISKDR